MAKRLTVAFDGLCGFVPRGGAIEVYLFSGHGMHGQQLLMPTDFIDVPNTTWKPTSIALIVDASGGSPVFRQVGIWSLKALEATFAEGSGQPDWRNREHMIDFNVEHQGSTASDKKAIRHEDADVGIVTLAGDHTVLAPVAPRNSDRFVLVKKNGEKPGEFARIVEWRTSSRELPSVTSSKGVIPLRADRDCWATISNAAPVPGDEGLKHFVHYYDALPIDAGDRMTIRRVSDDQHGSEAARRFADVYDCVPPVGYP